MSPTITPLPPEPAKDASEPQAPEAPAMEMPTGAVFTEVPAEIPAEPATAAPPVSGSAALQAPAEPEIPAAEASAQDSTKSKPAPKPKKVKGPKKPLFAVTLAVIIFAALAATAFYAYTKST